MRLCYWENILFLDIFAHIKIKAVVGKWKENQKLRNAAHFP
jgi:hypothetical protein